MPLHPDKAPGEIDWMPDPSKKLVTAHEGVQPELYAPFSIGSDLYAYESSYMYVDTAGGGENGDETVAWNLRFLHGYLFAYEMLCLPGGYSMEVYLELSKFALRNNVNEIGVEQNHGYGALAQNWRPELLKYYEKETGSRHAPAIIDDWVNTQKELRIIDTLAPVLGRHRLILNEDVLTYDVQTVMKYPIDRRQTYTLMNQLNKITRDHGSLIHEDRLDGLAGAVRKYVDRMAVDESLRIRQKMTNENVKMMEEWSPEFKQANRITHGLGSILSRVGSITKRRKRQ